MPIPLFNKNLILIKKTNCEYTFDGNYFENIEKFAESSQLKECSKVSPNLDRWVGRVESG